MEQAKIQLSAAEMALVCDAEMILTKNNILQKAKCLLEGLQTQMQLHPPAYITEPSLFEIGPKISRGENYLGLPYLVLDYPRAFGQNDIFAIRSFFWWGNFFSSTLQLSGNWLQQYRPKITGNHSILAQRGYYVQVGTDPWAHHFGPDNYKPVMDFSPDAFKDYCFGRSQIKIAAKWPLESWPDAANYLWESWVFLLNLCGV